MAEGESGEGEGGTLKRKASFTSHPTLKILMLTAHGMLGVRVPGLYI